MFPFSIYVIYIHIFEHFFTVMETQLQSFSRLGAHYSNMIHRKYTDKGNEFNKHLGESTWHYLPSFKELLLIKLTRVDQFHMNSF